MTSNCEATSSGTLFVLSAPSGAGKTSLVRALVDDDPHIEISVSHTTRPQRAREVDGDHYHFVSEKEFERMRSTQAFLEQATVFGHSYGTSRDAVQRQLTAGTDVILEIDWQGARQVRACCAGCVGVFILPPSLEQLAARLRGRGQDEPSVIARRLDAAVEEIAHYDEYDYLIVNDTFDTALAELRAVVAASRLARPRQQRRYASLLRELLAPIGHD